MKKLHMLLAGALLMLPAVSSCSSDDDDSGSTWDEYTEYREANQTWLNQMETRTNPDGSPFYQRLVPGWNSSQYILIHWFNNRAQTAGNLTPLYTSSVRVRYIGRNYAGDIFDADSTSENGTFMQVSQLIGGWQLALQNMHVGDSVEVLIPYNLAYGSSNPNALIPPYSALQFNLRLHDIPTLEVRP